MLRSLSVHLTHQHHKLHCVYSLYNITCSLSANAVAAGQAYRNIVKFIGKGGGGLVASVRSASQKLEH